MWNGKDNMEIKNTCPTNLAVHALIKAAMWDQYSTDYYTINVIRIN